MNAAHKDAHPDDAGLLRLLDDETDDSERKIIGEHVVACEECSLAFDELRHTSSALKSQFALDLIEPPAHVPVIVKQPNQFAAWKVAAGLVILLAATSALQPVRALVVSGWHSVIGLFATTETDSVIDPTTPVGSQPTGAVVSFAPRSSRLVIDVTSWQEAGELTIVVGVRPDVSAQVLSAESSESMTILPSDGVSIANTTKSVSGYLVTVPNTLEQVTVRIGGVQIVQFVPNEGDDPRVVRLIGG